MLAIALDIERFTSLSDFTRRVAALVKHVKSSPRAEGYDEIYVPGEVELRNRERRLADGIPVEQGTWDLIDRVRQRFGLADPTVG